AESFGIAGYRLIAPEALRRALEKSLAANEPALIEVPCGDMPSPWQFIDMPKVRGARSTPALSPHCLRIRSFRDAQEIVGNRGPLCGSQIDHALPCTHLLRPGVDA